MLHLSASADLAAAGDAATHAVHVLHGSNPGPLQPNQLLDLLAGACGRAGQAIKGDTALGTGWVQILASCRISLLQRVAACPSELEAQQPLMGAGVMGWLLLGRSLPVGVCSAAVGGLTTIPPPAPWPPSAQPPAAACTSQQREGVEQPVHATYLAALAAVTAAAPYVGVCSRPAALLAGCLEAWVLLLAGKLPTRCPAPPSSTEQAPVDGTGGWGGAACGSRGQALLVTMFVQLLAAAPATGPAALVLLRCVWRALAGGMLPVEGVLGPKLLGAVCRLGEGASCAATREGACRLLGAVAASLGGFVGESEEQQAGWAAVCATLSGRLCDSQEQVRWAALEALDALVRCMGSAPDPVGWQGEVLRGVRREAQAVVAAEGASMFGGAVQKTLLTEN